MLGLKRWHSRHVILCCGLLLLAAGCGLSEMFSGSNAEKITEPCIELIPSVTPLPTPTPIQTVIPVVTVTPQPGKTPTPSQSCGNAPGIVLICDGKPANDTPITVITPPPMTIYYTIEVLANYYPYYPCTGSVSPSGIVKVPAGTNAEFLVTMGTCYTFYSYLDSAPFVSGTFNTIVIVPNVTSNHVLTFYLN